MKTIKKEIDVLACEICGKEISKAVIPFEVIEDDKDNGIAIGEKEKYYFHKQCVDNLLIKEAKK